MATLLVDKKRILSVPEDNGIMNTDLQISEMDLKPEEIEAMVEAWEKLITPHGDLKPAADAPLAWSPRSHYPSWGFETGVACYFMLHGRSSLPLMGI